MEPGPTRQNGSAWPCGRVARLLAWPSLVPKRTRRGYCYRFPYCLLRLEFAGTRDIPKRAVFSSRCGPWDSVPVIVALIATASTDAARLTPRQLILLIDPSVAVGFSLASCDRFLCQAPPGTQTSSASRFPLRIPSATVKPKYRTFSEVSDLLQA
jgi:hypothetical protein